MEDSYPDRNDTMEDLSLVLGGVSVFVIVLFLVISGRLRDYLLRRIEGRRPRISISPTLPPFLTSEKQPASAKHSAFESFPPLRREELARVTGNKLGGTKTIIDEDNIKQSLLPLTANYEISADDLYTPTGFSVRDIKTLDTFPDYETLSGVPLPEAYAQFDINNALPRPYRPFRWNYHQTMCKLGSISLISQVNYNVTDENDY